MTYLSWCCWRLSTRLGGGGTTAVGLCHNCSFGSLGESFSEQAESFKSMLVPINAWMDRLCSSWWRYKGSDQVASDIGEAAAGLATLLPNIHRYPYIQHTILPPSPRVYNSRGSSCVGELQPRPCRLTRQERRLPVYTDRYTTSCIEYADDPPTTPVLPL